MRKRMTIASFRFWHSISVDWIFSLKAQFGAWTFGPGHGFARIVRWNLEKSPERLPSGDVEAIFSVMDSEFTRSMWNYPFRLTYRLILREKELHFNIGVYNPSKDHTFSFNLLLHTYFKVPDVRRCQVTGLHGCTFIDKVSFSFSPSYLHQNSFSKWRAKIIFQFLADEGQPDLSRRSRRRYDLRMDGQDLPKHPTRAYNNERCFR